MARKDTMQMDNILLLVDCQYDFIDGSLAVPGAVHDMGILDIYLNRIARGEVKYEKIFFTVDWHPINHCSFEANGGQWPRHCVQFTHGAAIYDKIFRGVMATKIPYHVIEKGWNEEKEAYSAFEYGPCAFKLPGSNHEVFKPENTHIDVGGIAYDYCVKNCVIDLAKEGYDIRVLRQFCPQIAEDTAHKATEEMKAFKNVEIIRSFLDR